MINKYLARELMLVRSGCPGDNLVRGGFGGKTVTTLLKSAGLVTLLARARKSHVRLYSCGLSEHYVEIFNITRLADFMNV